MSQTLPSLAGRERAYLAGLLTEMGVPERQIRMRQGQIWSWLYARGATDIAAMSDLSKELRQKLAARANLARLTIAQEQISQDGTRKWLFRLDDGYEVETVYIPEPQRGTLCISSQIGCTLNCSFCHTGTQKMVRNLHTHEIVGQLIAARDALDDWPDKPANRRISNIVMMGMGEPLYNADNVFAALNLMSDGDGLALSKRRITLSTSGVVPQMARCGEETGVMLAVSLHAVRDAVRDKLVPLNRKYNIATLLEACRAYPGLSNARRITFEYVMLDGINDSPADARELVRLLAGIPAKINLIPFNPWPNSPHACAPQKRIDAFAEIINRAGYAAPLRRPRGRDIMAACGQLKSASVKESAAARKRAALGVAS